MPLEILCLLWLTEVHESAQTHTEMPLEIVCLRSHTEVSEVTGQRKIHMEMHL